MFNPAIRAAMMAGVISKVRPKQVNTQSTPQKKKKKVNKTSGGMQVQRGGKGRRSLIST
jgi:capsid protein